MDWKTHREQLLQDPEVRQEIEASEPEYEIARAIIEARIKKGWSQQELARRLHTRQSSISRIENAKSTPSISFLKRLASVLDCKLEVHFVK